MGQTLSEPITTKNTAACSNTRYSVGSSSMQGWRINMEDAHVHLLEVGNDPSTAYFAVFDGHGGSRIAKHASLFLHKQITDSEAYEHAIKAEGRITEALIDGFLTLDERMRENAELREEMSGSTAVVVLIKNNSIYCANAGDSRAVVSVSGRAVPLSIDHKPSNEEESRRIFNAGGWVEFNRVNGNLALSRALGDFAFKNNDNMSAREQIVTACPEVETQAITADHEFIILACDGIWDVMGSQEVIDFCRVRLASGIGPEKICEELLNKCLAPDCELSGLGCDNMTAILVCLLQDLTQEEYKQQLQKSAPQPVYIDSTWQPPAQPTAQTDELVDAPVSNTEDSESGEEIFATPSHSPPVVLEEERANESPEDEERPPTFFKVPCESEQEKPPEEMIIEPQSQEQERFDER